MGSTELADVLASARELLARRGNDFGRSSWKDQESALEELDHVIEKVGRGHIPKMTLDVLFAPTGPIQEVSISSGWGQEFLAVAEKYDSAIARARPWWKFW
ncbi:MAG TPA: hypothetical protein VMT03_24705 [Polyangia bacterium]|nr:hypothetical protein [Polyangia bacterium]